MTRPTVFCKFLPDDRYCMLHKFNWFLALNVLVLYIFVFAFYGFYETTFFLLYVYLQNGKNNKRRKKKNLKIVSWKRYRNSWKKKLVISFNTLLDTSASVCREWRQGEPWVHPYFARRWYSFNNSIIFYHSIQRSTRKFDLRLPKYTQ